VERVWVRDGRRLVRNVKVKAEIIGLVVMTTRDVLLSIVARWNSVKRIGRVGGGRRGRTTIDRLRAVYNIRRIKSLAWECKRRQCGPSMTLTAPLSHPHTKKRVVSETG